MRRAAAEGFSGISRAVMLCSLFCLAVVQSYYRNGRGALCNFTAEGQSYFAGRPKSAGAQVAGAVQLRIDVDSAQHSATVYTRTFETRAPPSSFRLRPLSTAPTPTRKPSRLASHLVKSVRVGVRPLCPRSRPSESRKLARPIWQLATHPQASPDSPPFDPRSLTCHLGTLPRL